MGNCYSIIKPQDGADCQSHLFRTKVFKETQVCRVCQDVIWNEGRSCKSCKFTCHRRCEYKVITACVSPVNYPMPRNEEPKQNTLSQRNGEASKRKMMSPGTEIKTTIKSDGPVRYTFDLDVDYITERIIAMSFPSGGPEAQYRSNLKDVVNMLKTKHQNHYIIFNLSKRRNDIIKMNEQVLDVGWHDSLAPPLERLCSICKQIEMWLKKDPQNVVVLHCKGSRSPIGVVVLAYMNYINITASAETALDRYAMKRFMEVKTDSHVQPSQFRYEDYFTGLLTGAISINSAPLYLHHIVIHGVPNYDANGGCRPFVRIYQGMQTVYTSGVYTVPEGTTKFVISLDKALPLRGDILVKCYHKKFRSNTRDVIFRCQFHTTAVVEYRLMFAKEDLDDACTDARFPQFTKVEFIFASTGDRLHNSDYVSNSNFPVDNTDDPLIRWDSYENFSKLVEGLDIEPESQQPNGGNNNNLSPGSPKYIYASDGSPYAQVQKTPSFNRMQQPVILQPTREPQVNQQPPTLDSRVNGPHRDPNPYSSHNGPAGPSNGGIPVARDHQPSSGGRGVERTPSGRQINPKEQQELDELLRGIEDSKGMGGMDQIPGSPQRSPGVESPGNRRIVSVHAELKNAPLSLKKMSPARPIIEEEFENSPRNNSSNEQTNPPVSLENRPVEQTIVPQSAPAVESSFIRGMGSSSNKESVPNTSQIMHPLPNGNVLREGVPLEHANPTYDYTETDDTQRTGGGAHPSVVEEPIREVRLKASPVQLNSLESVPQMNGSTNSRTNYQPQPLRAQQQRIKFLTKYDDNPGGVPPSNGPSSNPVSGSSRDDGLEWLQRQQDKLKEQKEKEVTPQSQLNERRSPYYGNPLQVQEPSVQSSYQKGVHHGAPARTEPVSYSPGVSFSQSGTYSPSGSVKSEPVTLNTSKVNPPDNLSWLEQQQMKLREKRQREKVQLDPSYPLQVDTSFSASQLPSQPSSVSSVRSDVSGYSNTPYSHRQPDTGISARRGYQAEPLSMGGHVEPSQPPHRRGPPTPAYGYDNMDSSSSQGVVRVPSHDSSLESRPHRDNRTTTSTPKRSQSLTREPSDETRLFIDEPVSKSKGQTEAEANVNNSASVYSPNRYVPDTSLPVQSSSQRHPVNRSNSLGGYDSDSAIHYKPAPGKLPHGSAESWIQNPGGLPSQETEYWNRIEGLRSPTEKSPRDVHSSNESLPNGGTTPKFPVGPKGYANMVKTCIAVVGKPPHGPDEQLPLSPTREKPGADDFLETSFPIQPEPARKLDSNVRPVQESPLQVRRLEPAQVQLQEVSPGSKPAQPMQAQVDRVSYQVPKYAESQSRAPVGRERNDPLPQNDQLDLESLDALLESMTPVDARGGVPDRPISPRSYPDMGGREGYGSQYPSQLHKPGEPEIHYAEVQIEPKRDTQHKRSTPVEPVRYAHVQIQPTNGSPAWQETRPYISDSQYPQVSQHPQMMPSYMSSPYTTVPSQPLQSTQQDQGPWYRQNTPQPQSSTQVPSSHQPQPVVESISKTHISPAKLVLHDFPVVQTGEQRTPNQRVPIDAQVVVENRQQVSSNPTVDNRHPELPTQQLSSQTHGSPMQHSQPPTSLGYQSQPMPVSHGYPNQQSQPLFSQGYPSQQPASPSRSPGAQQVVPEHMQQPQQAVIEQSVPQHQGGPLPQYTYYKQSMPEHASSQHVQQQHISPQHAQQQHISPQHVQQQHVSPQHVQQQHVSPQHVQQQHVSPQHVQQQHVSPQHVQQQHAPPQHVQQQHVSPQHVQQQHVLPQQVQQQQVLPQHVQPQQQGMPQRVIYTQDVQQQHQQQYQHPQVQHLQQQSPTSGDLPSISFSEATPPPKHLDLAESPIFEQRVGGEESAKVPNLQNLETTSAPPPMYPTYSDRAKGRPQPLYPTFSDRHRKGHGRIDEVFAGAPNGNYKTLYDNRGGARGRGSSGSDGSAVSPGTTSPVRQAVSPAGPSPSPSGRSTPSNFYLMPYTSPYGSNSSLADPNKEHVRFVKDLSSWWYKPHISREEAIHMLRDKQPGAFVVRDSNSFPGAFGLAIKVAHPPANAPPKKGGDPTNELIRHFLIEPNTRGVRLKGCTNEPIFGSLSALIYQHTLTQLALPCKLVLPDVDPSGVDSPDIVDPKSAAALLQQGAACNVLYLQCVDMESLTGPSAVREAITRVMNQKEKPKGVKVHLKVSLKGVTLTDSARKLFFRKHFPVESILYCGMDPGSRKFPRMEGQDDPDAKCFGFVSRKPGSLTDNQCMVFAEYETEQPASAIVSFVTKVLLGSKQMKTP